MARKSKQTREFSQLLDKQKRLVLGNLKEVYRAFKENDKVGFSKFAELRPRHCILAGASVTHPVCV